jgi:hypothetical protein
VSLNLEADGVWARGKAFDELAIAEGFSVAWGIDFDVKFASSGFVEYGEVKSEGEGGSETSDLGLDGGGVDDYISDTVWAASELFADEDGIGVNDVKELNEFFNSYNVAKNVANAGFNRVGQKAAESIAGSNNSSVGNDLNEFVEGFIHEFNAWFAKINLGGGRTLLELSVLDLDGISECG